MGGERERPGRILKTDLYDEAISDHNLVSLFAGRCGHLVGTDVSLEIARAAKRRMADSSDPWHAIAVSDARNLAFRSRAFDQVISNSTLDHFSDRGDITESLRELRSVVWRVWSGGSGRWRWWWTAVGAAAHAQWLELSWWWRRRNRVWSKQ